MVAIDQLFDFGIELMQRARLPDEIIEYRDGLLIAILASRPLRRSNLASLRLETHVSICGSEICIMLSPEETKNKRPFRCWLPRLLTPYFERYINDIRPLFQRAHEHDYLWSSRRGVALTPDGLYQMVCRRTADYFGRAVNPHLFRDIAATAIATDRPQKVMLGAYALGQATFTTTEKHYIQAGSVEAGRAYVSIIESRKVNRHRTSYD